MLEKYRNPKATEVMRSFRDELSPEDLQIMFSSGNYKDRVRSIALDLMENENRFTTEQLFICNKPVDNEFYISRLTTLPAGRKGIRYAATYLRSIIEQFQNSLQDYFHNPKILPLIVSPVALVVHSHPVSYEDTVIPSTHNGDLWNFHHNLSELSRPVQAILHRTPLSDSPIKHLLLQVSPELIVKDKKDVKKRLHLLDKGFAGVKTQGDINDLLSYMGYNTLHLESPIDCLSDKNKPLFTQDQINDIGHRFSYKKTEEYS